MSFDLFFGCFHAGKKASFSRNLLEQHFAPYISRRERACITVDFGSGNTSYVYRDDTDQIDGFSINRPAADPTLYQVIFDLLRTQPLVLCLPGDCPPLIGNADTAPHVPADMVEGLGKPVILKSPNEILEWIHQA